MSTPDTQHPAPVGDRRALSTIAYGFMASKALFAALSVDLFTHVEAGRRTAADPARDGRDERAVPPRAASVADCPSRSA